MPFPPCFSRRGSTRKETRRRVQSKLRVGGNDSHDDISTSHTNGNDVRSHRSGGFAGGRRLSGRRERKYDLGADRCRADGKAMLSRRLAGRAASRCKLQRGLSRESRGLPRVSLQFRGHARRLRMRSRRGNELRVCLRKQDHRSDATSADLLPAFRLLHRRQPCVDSQVRRRRWLPAGPGCG